MGEFLSVVVTTTAHVRVVEQRDGAGVRARRVELAGEERSDALAVEDAQFDGSGRDRLDVCGVEPAKGAQNPQAGAKPLGDAVDWRARR